MRNYNITPDSELLTKAYNSFLEKMDAFVYTNRANFLYEKAGSLNSYQIVPMF